MEKNDPTSGHVDRPSREIPVVLLAGPTAVGKTALAMELAEALGTEIIGADSMQVYRYMDIGTAKPTQAERRRVPHHLVDVADPDEDFDAARYVDLARPMVDRFMRSGRVPLVVGGTGLYMKALTRGLCPGAPASPEIKEQLRSELEDRGLESLYAELARVDPLLARRLHPNDRQRILRGLEVHRLTGTPLSAWQERHRFRTSFFPTIKVALYRERDELYQRINRRTLAMMEEGFVDEVRRLLSMGYGPELKSMQSLGYRHICTYLAGRCRLHEAVALIQRDTRRYAKRQLTWFRGDPEFRWFHADDRTEILSWVRKELLRHPGN